MSFTVVMDCGHDMEIIDASEIPPLFGAWVMYPLDDDNSIDPGDEMTCVTCHQTKIVKTVGKDSHESPHS